MAHLRRAAKATPSQIAAMDKPQLESLITGSIKELGERVDVLDSINSKLGKLDKLDSIEREVRENSQQLGIMNQKLTETQAEITQIKQNADDLRAEIENLKGRVNNNESLAATNNDLQTKLQAMQQQQQDMNTKLDFLSKAVVYQQSMLEYTDAKFRADQIIIYGIDENDVTLGTDDLERAKKVIEKTNALSSIGTLQVRRLGNTQTNQSRPRALLVTLDDR